MYFTHINLFPCWPIAKPLHKLVVIVCLLLVGQGSRSEEVGEPSAFGDDNQIEISPLSGANSTNTNSGFVRLSRDLQIRSGIDTQALTEKIYQPETTGRAVIRDVAPLIRLQSDYQNARLQIELVAARLGTSGHTHRRLKTLYQKQVVSVRKYQAARSAWLADQAQLKAQRLSLEGLSSQALHEWGPTLSGWVLENNSPGRFYSLIAGKTHLVLLILDEHLPFPSQEHEVVVGRNSNRDEAVPCRIISPAPRTNDASRGETFFCDAASDFFRIGMRLVAWARASGEQRVGVELPTRAVVWYAGRPWAYLKTAPEVFQRRRIEQFVDLGKHWFVEKGFNPEEIIVTDGAQMLLSEENRAQIPDDDD